MEESSYGTFALWYESKGAKWYISVHPEMHPATVGIAPTGRYLIYCVHPERGSCHFILEQDKDYYWISEHYPPFIGEEFITWIGDKIESKNV